MLHTLSGRGHEVFTGVTVLRGGECRSETERTEVFFRPLTDREIEAYVDSGEPMYLVANHPNGTAYATFHDYKVKVAAKTGTVQKGSGISNNGVFMCYAPFDDPQIAIAIVVEHSGAGASLGPIAKDILNTYFDEQTAENTTEGELTILK